MATKTPKYELQKKEDNDFYNIEDLNANWDKVENALTEFDDSGTAEGITSFTDMLAKLVTGNKLAVTLRNLKAGLQFVLHTGSIVNNCVTDNAKLPLSAAQGKVLQDAITKLNGDLINTPQTPDIKAFCKSLSERQASCFLAQGSTYTGAQPDSTQQWVYEPGIAIRRWDVVYILWFSGTRNLAIGTYDVKTDTLTWNVK